MTNTTLVIALLSISLALTLGGHAVTIEPQKRKEWGKAIALVALIPFALSLILIWNPQLSVETWAYVAFFGLLILASWIGSIFIYK